MTFTFDHRSHVVSDDAPRPVGADAAAQWLRKDTAVAVALKLPDSDDGWIFKLFWAPEAGLTSDGVQVTGGASAPLTLTGGLSTSLVKAYPQLASYSALRVPDSMQRQLRTLLTDQLAVAAYDQTGALLQVTGVQLPGVLDDLYPGAHRRTLGPVWKGSTPQVSVWAPTAKSVALKVTPVGATAEQTVPMRGENDGV